MLNLKDFRLVFTVFSFFLISLIPISSACLEFKASLRPGEEFSYKHWNVKKKKITGYTHIIYQSVREENKSYILEINQNEHDDGKVYLEKKIWFNAESGEPVRYLEKDFRSGVEIASFYKDGEITTRLTDKKNQVKEFSISQESELAPFEVLTLYLRKNLPGLLKKDRIDFTIYMPVIASELAKKGLPVSLSKLSMIASVESQQKESGILGEIQTVQILVRPGSLLISSLLPEEKSNFRFTFTKKPPHYLLSFEEGETRSSLYQFKNIIK